MGKRRKRAIKAFEAKVIKLCREKGIFKGSLDINYRIYPREVTEQAVKAGLPAFNLLSLRPDLVEHFEDKSIFIWDVKSRCLAKDVGGVILYKTVAETNGRKVRGVGILCLEIDHVARAAAKTLGVRVETINPEEL